MSAYIIASYDIADSETYSAYLPGVVPLLAKHGAEVLVADYAPVRKIRLDSSANGSLVLAHEFVPPGE
jgi:uncharacterized protein (DUF1330 family)